MILAGAIVVVTGGSRGIGRACVLDAVAQGARVVFCNRHDGPERREIEAAAAAIGGANAAIGLTADVSDDAAAARLFSEAQERFGTIHGVVNNAAISREQLIVSATTDDWNAVIECNLTGTFHVAREAIRVFLEQGSGGRIVAVGTLSQYGVAGNASYATSKGGLEGLTRQIADQYAHLGILSTMVVPGYVETDLSAGMSQLLKNALIDACPMRRAGTPEEIASVVTHLLSKEAAGLDGQTIFAAGGLHEVPL